MQTVQLTIACSILLSMATLLVPLQQQQQQYLVTHNSQIIEPKKPNGWIFTYAKI